MIEDFHDWSQLVQLRTSVDTGIMQVELFVQRGLCLMAVPYQSLFPSLAIV